MSVEMGFKIVVRVERLLALKPGKGACPRPAAAKAWKVVASYDFFCSGLNTNYPDSG